MERQQLPSPPAVVYLDLESAAPCAILDHEDGDDELYALQDKLEAEALKAQYAHFQPQCLTVGNYEHLFRQYR